MKMNAVLVLGVMALLLTGCGIEVKNYKPKTQTTSAPLAAPPADYQIKVFGHLISYNEAKALSDAFLLINGWVSFFDSTSKIDFLRPLGQGTVLIYLPVKGKKTDLMTKFGFSDAQLVPNPSIPTDIVRVKLEDSSVRQYCVSYVQNHRPGFAYQEGVFMDTMDEVIPNLKDLWQEFKNAGFQTWGSWGGFNNLVGLPYTETGLRNDPGIISGDQNSNPGQFYSTLVQNGFPKLNSYLILGDQTGATTDQAKHDLELSFIGLVLWLDSLGWNKIFLSLTKAGPRENALRLNPAKHDYGLDMGTGVQSGSSFLDMSFDVATTPTVVKYIERLKCVVIYNNTSGPVRLTFGGNTKYKIFDLSGNLIDATGQISVQVGWFVVLK